MRARKLLSVIGLVGVLSLPTLSRADGGSGGHDHGGGNPGPEPHVTSHFDFEFDLVRDGSYRDIVACDLEAGAGG